MSQKTHFQSSAGATVHWLNHYLPAPLLSGGWFFAHFLLGLSSTKHPQFMSMVKFSPKALNYGYDFVLLVHFFGHPVYTENLFWRRKFNNLEYFVWKSPAVCKWWVWGAGGGALSDLETVLLLLRATTSKQLPSGYQLYLSSAKPS